MHKGAVHELTDGRKVKAVVMTCVSLRSTIPRPPKNKSCWNKEIKNKNKKTVMNVWMELQLHSSRREEMLTRQKCTEKIKRTIMEIVQITGFFISLFKKKKNEARE